ncbi:threonylcarbamoyl-AMP synthase [Acidaminobacter sp. JC074]|uniref:L-threonylcarbamoyladenylate synthase n=1 Tax=Acidaminobacter sp. JC074 TaxID=2530199 RepID=UPI001F0E7526|nr:L-threonylcarbamoyladenylate synthase [Acidaminobacter sp. JC074]MCH4889352.1 threonylcarbamoyl-AMP synthase [Acidaminobacter sp. JC074]
MKNTKVWIIKDEHDEQLIEAAKILKEGGTVAFPTETVYGLGANALLDEAVSGIYEAKGRPSDNPLIVHIADLSLLDELVEHAPYQEELIQAFWPGAITLIFKSKGKVAARVSPGLDTQSIRMPKHPVAKKLIQLAGVPVAAPSANLSGKPSPTDGKHVIEDLNGRVDGIVVYDQSDVGLESTILDLTQSPPMLLRPGGVTVEDIEAVIGKIQIDPALEKKMSENVQPRAPGMKYTHYSPEADVTVVNGPLDEMVKKIQELHDSHTSSVGIMCSDETKDRYKAENIISLGSRESLEEVASNLFKTLRQFDEIGVDIVLAEGYDTVGMGKAIMNRLNKAAGYQVINV